jgi:hypothetical protein
MQNSFSHTYFPTPKNICRKIALILLRAKEISYLNAQNLLEFIPLSSQLLNNFPGQICEKKKKESTIA